MIKIGVIGLGRMGITHLSILNAHPNIEVTAASDPSKIMNVFFSKYISGIHYYEDYHEMLEKETLDGVIISTPPNLHYKSVKESLKNGIHVFAEKPFTLSHNESSDLSNIAMERKLVNQVGYVNRFNDMFLKAKEMVQTGVLGKIIRFKSEMFSYTISKETEGDGWRGNQETGGGCLNEMASHAIDLVNYIVGVPDKVSGSVMNHVYSKGVDDVISSTLIYENGVTGTLYVNWCDPSYRKPSNKLEIFGIDGKMLVDQHDLKIFLKKGKEEFGFKPGWNTVYITDVFENVPFYVRGNEFSRQLYHFIDCICDNSVVNLCTFADAAETQSILKQIREDFLSNYRSN